MEMLKKNSVLCENNDIKIVEPFNKEEKIDFYFNGSTHRLSKDFTNSEDYGIICKKDKSDVITSFMTLDLRHTRDYLAEPEEIMEAYIRRQI